LAGILRLLRALMDCD